MSSSPEITESKNIIDEIALWKEKYESTNRELIEKDSIIDRELKYTDQLKVELTKIKEELKAKVDSIDNDKETSKSENSTLKQSLEKTKQELTLQQKENGSLKSELDS